MTRHRGTRINNNSRDEGWRCLSCKFENFLGRTVCYRCIKQEVNNGEKPEQISTVNVREEQRIVVEHLEAAEIRPEAVSYTHLDVYKRQVK